MTRWMCAVLACCLAAVVLFIGPRPAKVDQSSITGDRELATQVLGMLPDDYQAKGIHVSMITTDGVRHAGIGKSSQGQQYMATTPMETGSIAKTFVGQLLADAITLGEVKATDPVSTYLPELAGTPAGGASLEDLAAHRSGMPREGTQSIGAFLPQMAGLSPLTENVSELLGQAQSVQLGTQGEFLYSNLGLSLLGHALARAAGAESWTNYVTERLFTPVGMTHTTVAETQADTPQGAIAGTRANGYRGESLYGSGYGPAGAGVWSTPEDMTRYAQAALAGTIPGGETPRTPQWPTNGSSEGVLPGDQVGYAWYTDHVEGHTITHHGGTTAEYMTMLAIDHASGKAVMVFTDQNSDMTATGLAAALLTDGEALSSVQIPASKIMSILPAIVMLGAFTVVLLVTGIYTAFRAASVPSRMAVLCRTVGFIACLAAATVSGPWQYVWQYKPGWWLAIAALPGAYGVIRGLSLWQQLPTLPQRRAWLGWTHTAITIAFVALCAFVAWPKA